MARLHEVTVPDVGDKGDLSVAEVHVKPGDAVWADDTLVTVESGKAALDVPAPVDGAVVEVRVAPGEAVAAGHVVAVIEESLEQRPKSQPLRGGALPSAPPRFSLFAAFAATQSKAPAQPEEIECEMLVLGGGPGGYSAAFRAADLGMDTLLVERHAALGGVCLNVGCIPSKALLHLSAAMEEANGLAGAGIRFHPPEIDLAALRAHKDKVVGQLTGGLAGMARARKVRIVNGSGRFRDAHCLEVESAEGRQAIRFRKCIIAAGSHPIHLPFLPKDERIVDSSGALELRRRPRRMLVIGGGIVGLEMATVYSALGARLDVVEMQDCLMPGPDRDLARIWEVRNRHRFDNIMLRTRSVAAHADEEGVWVRFEGDMAPADAQRYDLILQSVGRKPNGQRLDAERAGVAVSETGFIPVNARMATNVPHIYAVGDIAGLPMLAHKAVHQGHVAAEAAAGMASRHDDSLIPGVAYTLPEVAWVGLSEDEARRQDMAVEVARFPWSASGRAIANGAEYGMTKLIFERAGGRLLGGAIAGPGAGDMIGEIALAVSRGCDAAAIGRDIHHPHPTLGETMGLAADLAHGSCTDLPPQRKSQSLRYGA
ncbi:MAG: dihydrolipoyl dehydrogenase [Rhodocyclales bacterium]|nr:dihydrolipoyl dehydrogenase [Rhodocyclaceae bacterium]PWB41103.1 MAG: dihydrolipoyl dehydrogenase [Rhodocyclales bacterium]GIK25705.1 MAG: dihydrolipoyl dehydrogenase [Betaproteobacteria bacterium]